VHGHRVEADACRRLLGQLAAVPVAQRRETRGLNPDRAPTIVAGAAILLQSIVAFGLDAVEVSEADILHGAALQAAGEVSGQEVFIVGRYVDHEGTQRNLPTGRDAHQMFPAPGV